MTPEVSKRSLSTTIKLGGGVRGRWHAFLYSIGLARLDSSVRKRIVVNLWVKKSETVHILRSSVHVDHVEPGL